MQSKWAGATGAGCARSVLISLLVAIVVVGGAAACLAVLGVVPLPDGVDRQAIGLAGAAIGLGALAIVGIAAALAARARRTAQLDTVFMPLGLAGRRYLTHGRQYHGSFAGRRVEAHFTRGPHLQLHLATPVQTRFAVAEASRATRAVASALGRRTVELNDAGWTGYSASALDEGWFRRLLADPAASQALRSLLGAEAGLPVAPYEMRGVTLEPGRLAVRWLYTDLQAITTERLSRALADLAGLARCAEALPPPQVRAQPTRLERGGILGRPARLTPGLAVAGAVLAALVVVSAVLVWVLLARP